MMLQVLAMTRVQTGQDATAIIRESNRATSQVLVDTGIAIDIGIATDVVIGAVLNADMVLIFSTCSCLCHMFMSMFLSMPVRLLVYLAIQ